LEITGGQTVSCVGAESTVETRLIGDQEEKGTSTKKIRVVRHKGKTEKNHTKKNEPGHKKEAGGRT